MEGREKNAETQAGCHRHVLHRILAAASPKRKCDRLFKVTSPAAHTHLTRARGHSLSARSATAMLCRFPRYGPTGEAALRCREQVPPESCLRMQEPLSATVHALSCARNLGSIPIPPASGDLPLPFPCSM